MTRGRLLAQGDTEVPAILIFDTEILEVLMKE